MRRITWPLVLIAGATGMLPVHAGGDFEAQWQNDLALPISRLLAQHDAENCGQYKYKESLQTEGVYRVRCTRDGETWHLYLVAEPTGDVKGPMQPDPRYD